MPETAVPNRAAGATATALTEVLRLERIDRDLFRSVQLFDSSHPLYGGQVMAQALLACGATVTGAGRVPHSLHGYFLRRGDAARPVLYRVECDRDGRAYSARRGVAVQDGEVVFSMSASFRTATAGAEHTGAEVLPLLSPGQCAPVAVRPEIALEARVQDWSCAQRSYPARFWVRPKGDLPQNDPLLHAAAIAYASDFSTGLARTVGGQVLGPSLDHALWFHRPPLWNDWLFADLGAGRTAGKRGWYTGSLLAGGEIVASLAQEMAYR
ncbi:acyl-CoA thioesterase [Nocardia harenae]|uniref:acyl-CoA thioesterase n=1 Tax=Nocardia harenae TaxID=358707 RepID=UPI000830F641|nr:acyl-CoA thioesterase domain-containing protein [Nocardia harenae]